MAAHDTQAGGGNHGRLSNEEKFRIVLGSHFGLLMDSSASGPIAAEVKVWDGDEPMVRKVMEEEVARWLRETTSRDKPPKDCIPTRIALKWFVVSRSTLKRRVEDGKLQSHRPENAPKNATHQFSEAGLRRLFDMRQGGHPALRR